MTVLSFRLDYCPYLKQDFIKSDLSLYIIIVYWELQLNV